MDLAKARLIEASHALQRKVYASLPWGVRLGHLLFNLRYAADPSTFGKLAYGIMLMQGVEGLPRTSIVPTTIREIDRLPRAYGLEFGNRAQAIARKYLRSDDDVAEVLSKAALKLVSSDSGKTALKGKTVRDAENYVLRLVQNQALDFLRSQKVRRYEDISEMINEPGSWDNLAELIPEAEQERIKEELESAVSPKLMPDLPLYFELLLDGHSNKQIAEDRMLPSLKEKPMSQQGLAKYRDKIKDVLRSHFDVQASACC